MFPGSDMSGWGRGLCTTRKHPVWQTGVKEAGEDGLGDIYRQKNGRKRGPTTFTRWYLRGKEGGIVVERMVKGWWVYERGLSRKGGGREWNCGCQTSDTSACFDHPTHTHLHFLHQTHLHPIIQRAQPQTTSRDNTDNEKYTHKDKYKDKDTTNSSIPARLCMCAFSLGQYQVGIRSRSHIVPSLYEL